MTVTKEIALSAVLTSLVMAVLRSFVVARYMEKNVFSNDTYYLADTLLVRAFTVAAIVVVILFAVVPVVFTRKKGSLLLERGSAPIGSLVASFSLFGASMLMVAMAFSGKGAFDASSVLMLALMIGTAVKFFVLGMQSSFTRKCGAVDAMATLFPIVFSGVRLVEVFLSTNASPLASSGAYHILGLASAMLFFLYEGKSCIRRTSGTAFTVFACCATFFLFVFSVPNILLHCFGTFDFDMYAAFSVVDLGLGIYIIARLASAKHTLENK